MYDVSVCEFHLEWRPLDQSEKAIEIIHEICDSLPVITGNPDKDDGIGQQIKVPRTFDYYISIVWI